MLLVPVNEVRSIGIGGLLVTIVSVLVATTVLPLILVLARAQIDMGFAAVSRARSDGADGLSGLAATRSWFYSSSACRY